MASLPPHATNEDVEEELVFLEVLIASLDDGADDYAEKLATFQGQKEELEKRLDGSTAGSRPHTSERQIHTDQISIMDGSHDRSDAWWQTTLNGRPGSNGSQAANSLGGGPYDFNVNSNSNANFSNPFSYTTFDPTFGMANTNGQPPNPMKRPLPYSMQADSLHPSKRPTPEPSNAATPTSSTDSSESFDRFGTDLSERSIRRQIQAEAALRRQRDMQSADEKIARSLSQQNMPSSYASSSRPSIQTTLNHNGSYQRPPPRPALPEPQPSQSYTTTAQYPNLHLPQPGPSIKQEPGFPREQQLVQRSRVPEIVDLTNSDDDEDVSEITRNHFTPNRRIENTPFGQPSTIAPPAMPMPPIRPQQLSQMPGSFPMLNENGCQSVYGNNSIQGMYVGAANSAAQPRYPWMQQQQTNPLMNGAMNAVSGIRNVANTLGNSLQELGNLVNGSKARPWSFGDNDDDDDDEDDDIIFGGSRPINRAPAPYADNMELYQNRHDAFANYDPSKTTEEINALLENIRPDEDMPQHLRVQTPAAMAVQLHKYQELGLTWLQKCEDGTNKGGILADDMGLGKTIQMLSLIVTRKSDDIRCKTTLIVAPVALMRQWRQEIEQKVRTFPHHLSVFVHHGQTKKKSFHELSHYDVVLTTFGSLAAELKKLESFSLRRRQFPETRPSASERCVLLGEDARWYRVVLDEAQCIKNVKTQTSKAACVLQAKFRWCMTGTPMMNSIEELYSLIKFLRIKPYAEWTKFRMDFVTPMKNTPGRRGGPVLGREKAMNMLQILCKAIMLRRTKKSTFEGKPILVLPERTTEIENPEFSEDEESFYRALENRTQLQFNKYLRAGTVGSSYSAILVLLLRLRQACCHPHLIKDFGVSAAADVSPDTLLELARTLDPQVVERIKLTGGNFECPVCYDAVTNPAIFIPCGHDTCSDCFARIADPANAIRDGNENATNAKCPNCRAQIDPKRITDFDAFKKVHMQELLTEEEQDELNKLFVEFQDEDGDDETDESETDSETDSDEDDDEIDAKGNLKGFVANDDEETESEAEEDNGEAGEDVAGPSTKIPKGKDKVKLPKKSKGKKSKGKRREKGEKKGKKTMTLADLKKLSTRNANARKAYIRRLRADWMTSAKIEKTLEILRGIIDDPAEEKVLIFSQWTSLLDLLEVPISREKWNYRRYDGSMSPSLRGDAVDDFRDPRKNVRIMLVSLKAGNAGLNLNAANNVIVLDPFWNPYIEEQAIDRAHRLGQTRPVKVQRILVPNTVEDRIIELQEKKRALISEALDEKAGQSIARLGVQELAYLFGVTRNPNERVQYRSR